ncbi:MAG: hypothetical protein IKW51_08785 [Bacteroidales bacterium]|nr:hypothetical protein [Bacteroidales bacterium]
MGRGNVCTFGKYEGLYYADRDYLDFYVPIDGEADEGKMLGEMEHNDFSDYEYDEFISRSYYEDFISEFISLFCSKFKSFSATGEKYGIILENELFTIEVEDNEWSYAVKLIQKENDYDNHLEGLQKKHHGNYLEGMKNALLEIFPSIGCYCGAWTSGRITRKDAA